MQFILSLLMVGTFMNMNAQVMSTFDTNDEGWLASGDAISVVPQYVPTGGNPGGYISSTDEVTGAIWYWSAPAKFKGNQLTAFGKMLQFDLRQSGLNNQLDRIDVSITGSGITIVGDLEENPLTTWTHYEVPLNTTFAWKINTLTGTLATEDEIQNVLTNITNLRIRGEYINGPDIGDLDNVVLPGSTLPIYLLKFDASKQKDKTLLEWSTSNEINSFLFDVEYSVNGRVFESIGTVNAAINSRSINTYSFIHNQPIKGINFYRLKMVDEDGAYKYSQVVKIIINQRAQLEIFPNPTTGGFTIGGLAANRISNIQLLDITGKVINERKVIASSFYYRISEYQSGIYFIRVFSGNNIQQLKIIKQ